MSCDLFAGVSYDPGGGWGDHVGSFRTIAKARCNIDQRRTETMRPAYEFTFDSTFNTSTSSRIANERRQYTIGEKINGDGNVIAVDGDLVTVRYPEHVEVSWGVDWAHIVRRGKIILDWDGGAWSRAR